MTTIDTQALGGMGLGRPAAEKKDHLGQSEFLKLMIAQLNNQDPTKPMESGEFYTQIAQFSTVSGIQDLQASFQQVASAMYSNQALQASAMVGRSVLVSANTATLPSGGEIAGRVEVPVGSSQVNVNVYDSAGQLVRRVALGPQAAGQVAFAWDGRNGEGVAMPPGTYHLETDMQFDGQSYALETLVSSRVDSVTLGRNGQGILLNLSSGGQADLASVKQIM